MKIIVLAEGAQALAELCSSARNLGDCVEALYVGDDEAAAKEIVAADKVWVMPVEGLVEDSADAIVALVEQQAAEMVVADTTVRMRLLAGRIAAKLGTSVIANASGAADGSFARTMYGGAGVATVKAATSVTVATMGAGALEPVEFSGEPEVEVLPPAPARAGVELVERVEKPRVSVDLTKSARVIGVGRGIKNEEDLAMVRELADAIGAGVGCTRPISEGEKWMPKETYIGVSGLVLKPEIYIALGISGQIQHVFGVNRSKVFIAVNRDSNAMVFDSADYGIVGDLYKVVPKLIEAFK